MDNTSEKLRSIADASRRNDGSDIPLGEQCRKAADELDLLRETKDALVGRVNRLQDEGAELRRQYSEVAAALRGYRDAFANGGETTSLHDWNERMKAADLVAAKFV